MAGDRQVKVTIVGDASSLKRAFEDGAGHAGKFAGAISGAATVAGGFVLGKAITEAPAVFQSLVGDASDMAETLSKSNTIFGDQGKAIETWAGGAAKGFGQSKQQALEAAATFGNLFTQLGIGTGQAAGMSQQMVELASDFASFHNADPSDVLDAMTAAFRGEYDAVQRYVPTINAAAVAQKALEMTGKKTTKELTDQEKALATQKLLFEGAGAAAGDFARTQDGNANKTRILQARFADLKTELGEKLLPVQMAIGTVLLDRVLPMVEDFAAAAGPVIARVTEFVKTEVLPRLQEFGAFFQAEIQPKLEAFWAWEGERLRAFGALFNSEIKPRLQEFAAAAQAEFQKFRGYWDSEIKPALDNIRAGIEAVIGFIREHWPEIERIIRPVLDQVVLTVETAFNIVKDVLDLVIQLIQGDFSGAWRAIERLIGEVWEFIKGTIGNQVEAILGILGVLKDLALAGFGALKDGAIGLADELKDGVVGVFGEVRDKLGEIADGIKDRVLDAFRTMADVAKGIVNGLLRAVNGVINAINRALEISVSIPGVNMPGPVPDIPGVDFNFNPPDIPSIPLLARGGLVRARAGGTLALLAEGGQDEAVIPLDQLKRSGAFGRESIYIDMRGAQFTGSPQENERMMERVVRRVLSGQGRESRLHGFN